jgi:predicted PurR-regulated permease PerM
LGVTRPLLLGWFVNCLVLIPVAGTLAAAIAWTAVLMMVFEEVEGISRLQAFGISAGINVCFFLVQLMLTPVTRHL